MTLQDFRHHFDALSNWGRWGGDDELGTLNLVRPGSWRPAVPRRVSGLGRPVSTEPGWSNFFPMMHGLLPVDEASLPDGGSFGHVLEFFSLRPHGQAFTHLDALCHFSLDGRGYNGFPASPGGLPQHGTVEVLGNGLVGRGVLLDIPAALGIDWVEPGHSVSAELAELAVAAQGTELRAGDLVFLRTGRDVRAGRVAGWDTREELAGGDVTLLYWLKEHDVSVLGCDGVTDTYPSPVEGIRTPMHIWSLVAMGMPLIDNCYLEDLAAICREAGSWEFSCALSPMVYPGGSGTPVNPLAWL